METPSPTRHAEGTIGYAIGETTLGPVLVAEAGAGAVAVMFGEDREALQRQVRQLYPSADLDEDAGAARGLLEDVVARVDTPEQVAGDVPVDPHGTPFQMRVWRALREIPAGATATYAEVARHIGAPMATRAVAGACAANSVAVLIPCHRVVRTDASLGGYRWGVERKRTLLDRESVLGNGKWRWEVEADSESGDRVIGWSGDRVIG